MTGFTFSNTLILLHSDSMHGMAQRKQVQWFLPALKVNYRIFKCFGKLNICSLSHVVNQIMASTEQSETRCELQLDLN